MWPPATFPFAAIAQRGHREQYVQVTSVAGDIYKYDYGLISFHEGCISKQGLRPLTAAEHQLLSAGTHWKLPQQFYQTGAVGMPPLDTPERFEVENVRHALERICPVWAACNEVTQAARDRLAAAGKDSNLASWGVADN